MNSTKIIVEGSDYPPSDRSGTGFSKFTLLLGQEALNARLSLLGRLPESLGVPTLPQLQALPPQTGSRCLPRDAFGYREKGHK